MFLIITQIVFDFGEIKVFTRPSFEYIQNVETSGFKVSGGVVGSWNKHLWLVPTLSRLKVIRDCHKPRTNYNGSYAEDEWELSFKIKHMVQAS